MSDLPAASAPPASASSPAPVCTGTAPTDGDGEKTALQKHVAFFDRNGDGIIYPWEMCQGFRAIGLNIIVSIMVALFVCVKLHLQTRPGWLINPFFPTYIKNIHKTKHGSDTGIYDKNGRFVSEKFEEIFGKDDALTYDQLMNIVKANKVRDNYNDWFPATMEWRALFYLTNKDGKLRKETVVALYDGSLFPKMAEERASKKKN